MEVKINPVIAQGNDFVLPIVFERGQRNAADWERIRSTFNQPAMTLMDADNGRLTYQKTENLGSTADWASFRYVYSQRTMFGKVGPPAKLVMDVPADVRTIDVPVKFENLPLP